MEEANLFNNAHDRPFQKELCTNKELNNANIDTLPEETKKQPSHIKDNEPLTTKFALKFLLEESLQKKVCRYCLKVSSQLSNLDQVMQVAGQRAFYKVTIRDMIASFHPIKITNDPNQPNKICDSCLNLTISSYLFTQQCERAERALRNCFHDMYEKLEKLDSLDRPKKRGRQKLNPNFNILNAEHRNVIDYADPVINIVNTASESITNERAINIFECPKCWQVLPNTESLISHEKTHPKTMWYNCRLCGKSFAKRYQFKRHFTSNHAGKQKKTYNREESFKCNQCWQISDNYNEYLQHIEKHKFKTVMDHLVHRKMDRLCSICLCKSVGMVDLDNMVRLHGGCTELTGDRSLHNILGSTLPEMNNLHNYTGTKICEKCLNNAITSFIFINEFHYVRNRLNTCVTLMLDQMNRIPRPHSNIFVEISQNVIMPAQELFDENLLLDENDDIDESKLKTDVLEDEFRVVSDSEGSGSDSKTVQGDIDNNLFDTIDNPAKNVTKTYMNRRLVNGYQFENKYNSINDICSEFLTFKKKTKPNCLRRYKFTCPICNKHFISTFFLKRHVLKHVNRTVECKTCNKTFKSKFCLYEHAKMSHLLNENIFYTCQICERCFMSDEKLKSHAKKHKKKTCQLCDKVFRFQKHYDCHMQRHSVKLRLLKKKRVRNCSFCEKECSNGNKLSVHVNKIHLQIKPYACEMCDKQFYTENNLYNHKKVHSMYSKEICQFCNKTLTCREQLVVHVRKHIGIKPYICQICTKTFYTQSKMKKHMKQSHGGRFCCKFCKIAFTTKSLLKEHVSMIHDVLFVADSMRPFDGFNSNI